MKAATPISLSLIILCLVSAMRINAQSKWSALDNDSAFSLARHRAFTGERSQARRILLSILDRNPDYHEVRTFLGRTYAWDNKDDSARTELQLVLKKSPEHEDATNALADLEMWEGAYDKALDVLDAGLRYHPDSPGLLLRKAKILNKLERWEDALHVLDKVILSAPDQAEALALRSAIIDNNKKYAIRISYGADVFSRSFDPAHYSAVQVSRANAWGSAILRLNYSQRFSSHGFQPEFDLYPKIADGVYAYLNYGYSECDLFPRHRAGGEIFSTLPGSFEASLGFRYLYFGPGSKVFIYTGSGGLYFGNYWLSIRPYVTPGGPGTSFSFSVSVRRYMADADSYLGLKAGLGYSPDERKFQTAAGLNEDGLYSLKSQNVGLSWQTTLRHNLIFDITYALTHQELSFDFGEYVWVNGAYVGLKKKL